MSTINEAQERATVAHNAHEDFSFAVLEEMVKISAADPSMDGEIARARAAVKIKQKQPELYQAARDGLAFLQGKATAAHESIAESGRRQMEFEEKLEESRKKRELQAGSEAKQLPPTEGDKG